LVRALHRRCTMSTTVPLRIAVAAALLCLSPFACGEPDSTSDEATAKTGASAGQETADAAGQDACVQRVFCILIDHWDSQLCRCVPNFDAGPPVAPDAGSDGCDKRALCIDGFHWDLTSCACVPDVDAGGGTCDSDE
jgi:hypothetical protein